MPWTARPSGARRPGWAFMPQQSIWDNVTLALAVRGRIRRKTRPGSGAFPLECYGLWVFRDKRPGQLSGGSAPCCALIRTLAILILLLDEPFRRWTIRQGWPYRRDIYRIIRQEGNRPAGDPRHQRGHQHVGPWVKSWDPAARRDKDRSRHGTVASPPMERRTDPGISHVFNAIWKELEVHEG